ncbi:MAG: hypothetical protein MI867_30000 [Pseudomonadales bacterium]|nr:hypothetical protein [Pseudomonadales bacterium]
MTGIARWAVLVLGGMMLLGCGGKSEPTVEDESGIVVRFNGYDSNRSFRTRLEPGLFVRDSKIEIEKGGSITVHRDDDYLYDDNDTDDESDDDRVHLFDFGVETRYINNTLDDISFSFGPDLDYGYDITITQNGSTEVVWQLSEMLDWCVDFENQVRAAVPDLDTLQEDEFDFGFNQSDYTPPSSLDAADDWFYLDDRRVATCPVIIVAVRWIGREMGCDDDDDCEDNGIKNVIYDEYEQYVTDFRAHEAAECEEGGADEGTDVCDTVSRPTSSSLVEAIVKNASVVAPFNSDTETLVFDMVIDYDLNEFASIDPITFTLNVVNRDLD